MTFLKTDLPKKVDVEELKLADIIDLGLDEGYSTATVESIDEDGIVKTIRP